MRNQDIKAIRPYLQPQHVLVLRSLPCNCQGNAGAEEWCQGESDDSCCRPEIVPDTFSLDCSRVDITPYVGSAFRLLRERHSLSQEQLALNAGLDRTYVSGIERSRRNPSLKSMQRMASELSVSLDEVFTLARDLAEQSQAVPAQKRMRTKR